MQDFFRNLFGDLFLPVIVCRNQPDWPVVYLNARAGLILSPTHSVDLLIGKAQSDHTLDELLRFKNAGELRSFSQTAQSLGRVDDFRCEIFTYDDKSISVSLSGLFTTAQNESFFLIFIVPSIGDAQNKYDSQLSAIINTAFFTDHVDTSINNVLALAGEISQVSRVYIFEETSPTMTSNTYEWCAPGVVPAIDDLKVLPKADYNYDVIVNSGMYITNDVSQLPDGDREILEMQGIRSLAIIPIYDNGKPLGYVGFDDCEKTRVWSHDEVQYLKSISILLGMLIVRRKNETELNRSFDVLQLISDNSGEIVYANSLNDYTLLFVNKALSNTLGKPAEELIGKKCYDVLHRDSGVDGPCEFCPIPKISWDESQTFSDVYIWELENKRTQKTYLAKDNIIKWIDGQYAHVETAIDITDRIEHEAQLRYFARTDVMTGISNREWGSTVLEDKFAQEAGGSLCFIDVDGLKITNDTYGHAAGDELLTETVAIIQSKIGDQAFFCRWGGDEFLVWLPELPEVASVVIDEIENAMRLYNDSNEKVYKLSISVGIVPFVRHNEETTLDTIVTQADTAMYDNKMKKRGRLHRRRRDDNLFD